MKKISKAALILLLVWNGYLTFELIKLKKTADSTAQEAKVTVLNGVLTNITELVKSSESKLVKVKTLKNELNFREGSGIIFRQDNNLIYIVTSYYNLDGSSEILVEFASNDVYSAELIGYDETSDVAVIKVESEFQVEPFNMNINAKMGEYVLTLGYKSFQNAVSFGVITGNNFQSGADLNDDNLVDWHLNLIQTDANINNENNGGAMININGELIGLNLSKVNSENKNVALNAGELSIIVDKLIENGIVNRVFLGSKVNEIGNMGSYEKSFYGIGLNVTEGVYISELSENSPYYLAGLRVGDVISEINGESIESAYKYSLVTYNFYQGESVRIVYLRNNQTAEVTVSL